MKEARFHGVDWAGHYIFSWTRGNYRQRTLCVTNGQASPTGGAGECKACSLRFAVAQANRIKPTKGPRHFRWAIRKALRKAARS